MEGRRETLDRCSSGQTEAIAKDGFCRQSRGQTHRRRQRSVSSFWPCHAAEVCLTVICLLARPAGGSGETPHRLELLQWPGTQQAGAGCLRHSDCAEGHFCSAETPPEHECTTERGWKVRACGTCRKCAECTCNEDAVDAQCPKDQCPLAPTSVPRTLEGSFHGVMRIGQSLCYVSFDFYGGIFTQISSELSPEAKVQMGINDDLTKLTAQRWFELSGGLPLTEDSGNMCSIPTLGRKSGIYRIVNKDWPVEVELETTDGFIEMANEDGFYLAPTFGTPLRPRVARLTLDMMHCPFFLMTYTLPDSIYYLGYDLIYKANWARGYTYNSRGDLGPGFYAGFRSSKLSVVYAGDTDARKSEARDAVLGFSRTREILGGELIFGSSTSPKALSELEHVRCRFRYHTSPHNLGLQQFRLQIFGCQEAGPHSEEQSGTSLRSYRSDSSFTRVPSVYSQGRHFSDNEARKGLTIRAVSEIEEDPGLKTTDWLLAGRGVQYNISDLELLDLGSAPDLYWWSETRVAKAYAAAGKPKENGLPTLEFQGISVCCQSRSRQFTVNETVNGTNFQAVLGRLLPPNYLGVTRYFDIDDHGWLEISYLECVAEFFCQGFADNLGEMRQWCKCPPGTYSSTGFGPCNRCSTPTCDSNFAQTTCTTCPICVNVDEGGLTAGASASSLNEVCRCPLGFRSLTLTLPGNSWAGEALGPCEICPRGTTQPTEGSRQCISCPPSPLMTTTTRYTEDPTWAWQKLHVQHTLTDGATGKHFYDSCIDIMGFFEEFVPVGWQDNGRSLRVKATFEIPQENGDWISERDIVAIYKGSGGPTCDEARSFHLCASERPTRQLAWAYASVAQSSENLEVSVLYTPGPEPLLWNSFTFQFPSAGPGTYYMLYHSHTMNQIVLQLDYNAERDYVPPGNVFAEAQKIPADTGHRILGFGLETCPPGYKINTASPTGCDKCPLGYYSIGYNNTACIGCPVGTYGGEEGVCSSCLVGKSSFEGAATNESCILCSIIYDQLQGQVVNGEILVDDKLKDVVQNMSGCSEFVPDITVIVTTPPPIECGNNILEADEECDDGFRDEFTDAFDGCHKCKAQHMVCGDGVKIDTGTTFDWDTSPPTILSVDASEMCDDGNTVDGDGCSHECSVEARWACWVPPFPDETNRQSLCRSMCGDGTINQRYDEECDDFNEVNHDGCSAACKVECGYECAQRSGISFCQSECGDGILAFDEQCEFFTIDNTLSCNILTCKVWDGWQCERVSCEDTLVTLIAEDKQRCTPICGDRVVIEGQEECDLGDASNENYATKDGTDWPRPWTGGIGPDRSCNEYCKPNRDIQCFGGACASRQVPLVMKQDLGMPLLDLMLNGRDLSGFRPFDGVSTVVEGLQLIDVQNLDGISHFLGKLVILDPTNIDGPRTFFGAAVASFASPLDKLKNETNIYRCTTCAGHEIVTARRANISVVKGALTFPASCTWTMQPIDRISGRLLMDVSALSLGEEESLVFEEMDQTGTRTTGKLVLRFDGPLELRHLDLGRKVFRYPNGTLIPGMVPEAPFDTHFDLPWNVRIRFSTGNHQVNQQAMSTSFRFSIHLMPSIDRNSIGAKYIVSDATMAFVNGLDDDTPTRAADQRATTPLQYASRRMVMKVQGYTSYGPPCDFSQDYKSMVLPMETEASGHKCITAPPSCQDHVQPGEMFDSDAPTFYEGSWEGQCITTRNREYEECNIFLRIVGIDIEQHVTGINCPPQFQGRKSGLVKIISRSTLIPVKDPSQGLLLKYSEITVLWLYGATGSEIGNWINALISAGPNDFRSPRDVLTVIWGTPGVLNWPSPDSFLTTDLPRCMRSEYKALLPDVRMRLPPFLGADEIVLQQGLIQKTEANEIGWVVSCNNSLTKILELRQQSSECKTLVEVLLLQDPLQTLPASLSGELCTNTCSQMIVDKADSALQVCRSSWEQVWATSAYHGMIFKQLLTLASLKYWMYLDCSSNRHRKSCLGAASMQSLEMSDCSAFQGKFLPPEHPFDFGNSSLGTALCSQACKSALDMYVQKQHCCVSTLEDADAAFMNILYHPHLQHIEVDLKIQSDPFDLREKNVTAKYPLAGSRTSVTGNSTRWSDACPTCLYIPVDQTFQVSKAESSAGPSSVGNFECPASRVASSCAMGLTCRSLNWLPSCCDAFECVRGSKHYPGSCLCACPDGYSGAACDKRGMFVAFDLTFPGETLDTFNLHKLRTFVIDLSIQLRVKTEDVEWEEPTESVLRRRHGAGERRLLASAVGVYFRIFSTNFVALDKLKEETTAAFCKPDFTYVKDFSCDLGPAMWYNASLLNPIPPPPPPPSPPPATTPSPPPEVKKSSSVNVVAILISLCVVFVMLVTGLSGMRLWQESSACQQWTKGETSLTSLCCLLCCFKALPPKKRKEDERDVYQEPTSKIQQNRKIELKMHSLGSIYSPRASARRSKENVEDTIHFNTKFLNASGLQWKNVGFTKPAVGRELHNDALSTRLMSTTTFTKREWDSFLIWDLRPNDHIKAGHCYFIPIEGALNTSDVEIHQLPKEIAGDEHVSGEERQDFRSDEYLSAGKRPGVHADKQDQLALSNLSRSSQRAALASMKGVEFSTKAQLRWVEEGLKSDQRHLSALSLRGALPEIEVMSKGAASPVAKCPTPIDSGVDASHIGGANTPTLLSFDGTGASSTYVRAVEGNGQVYEYAHQEVRPVGRFAREKTLDQLSEVRTHGITAELGFTPRPQTPPLSMNLHQQNDWKPAASLGARGAGAVARSPRRQFTKSSGVEPGVRLGSTYKNTEDTAAKQILQQFAELRKGTRRPQQQESTPDSVPDSVANDTDSMLGSVDRNLSARVHNDYSARKRAYEEQTQIHSGDFSGREIGL